MKIPITCPKCGKLMEMRTGKYGEFLGCTRFPSCRFTFDIENPNKIICPICGNPMEKRTGKYGEFLGCTKFPKCRFTINIAKKKTKYIPMKKLENLPKEQLINEIKIMIALSNEWQNLDDLCFRLNIKDKLDAKYLKIKLNKFIHKGLIKKTVINNEFYWKRN
ncbi:MAG: topoisomerase DNA-binding C4 zinc finger domain-containing protein [Promethearchaeota archaeon]